MKKKSYISTKFIILIPVFILGFVSVVSNILAVTNIKRVNANATQIANGYMSCISELGDIQKETLLIHRLGLSIVPTENRDSVAVRAEVSSKLVPVKPIDGALLLGGTDAEPIVMEYTPQVPGQQSFDPTIDTEPKVVKLA